MPDLVTITIDDVEYKVPNGMLLTEAAKVAGIDIPVFCSHPKLDPLGACRMCLVEQDVRGRWMIVTACTIRAAEGLKFRYASPAAVQAREDTLEFLLINHPLDCPICDKGGECPLQDQTLKHGPGVSQFQELKNHKAKRYPISDLIMLDQERCIICWRCVRYLEEWEDKPQLGLFHRGDRTVIDFFPGQPVDAKTSGNIIDLCPVGALTNRVSRFRYRPWETQNTDSICVHCSQGCNVRLDGRIHELRRVVARENMAVNDEWICDKGRFMHAFADSPQRLTTPLIRDHKGGELRQAGWDEALALTAQRLAFTADVQGPAAVGALGSARLSNEAAYLLQKLMRGLVGSNNIDHRGGAAVLADPRGLSAIRDVEQADLIVLAGVDPAEEQPVLATFIRRAVRRRGAKLLILHPRQIEDTRYPGAYLPYKPGQEAALFDGLSRGLLQNTQVKERAIKLPGFAELVDWLGSAAAGDAQSEAVRLVLAAQRPLILYGPALVSGRAAAANRASLMNFALLAGCAERTFYLAPEANSVGARDMGLLPASLPGHAATDEVASRERLERLWGVKLPAQAGMGYDEMLEAAAAGRLRALYLVGSDPASQGPAGQAALQKVDFLVVQDLFLTESARLADVVLPAVSWAETDGTFTNLERRVQRAPQTIANPHSQAAPDWLIFTELAKLWPAVTGEARSEGKKSKRKGGDAPRQWGYAAASEVLEEITRAVPMYDKLNWAALGEEGKQWPLAGAAGSPLSPAAVRRLVIAERRSLAPGRSDYPYTLVAGQVLLDYGTLLRPTAVTEAVAAPVAAGINPADAAREKLVDGQLAAISSAVGQVVLPVRLDETVQPGTLWIPYSLPGAPAETLLGSASPGVGAGVRIAAAG
ncbi:MAG: NADH-quinone oxidoreductase subunit NuoG [Anaerolinea sp.]|nr:NADH-quinone oxidoreductase subunit NuoG [Anaerolinea sp.]